MHGRVQSRVPRGRSGRAAPHVASEAGLGASSEAIEVTSLMPYLAAHWWERYYSEEDEPGIDAMFHPAFYLSNGRCWLQGGLNFWPVINGGTEDEAFVVHNGIVGDRVFTGLPSRFCPPTTVTIGHFGMDSVNTGGKWLSDTFFDATLTADGTCTLIPRSNNYPKLPVGYDNDLYLCLDGVSWEVSGDFPPDDEDWDLTPYTQPDVTAESGVLHERRNQVRATGEVSDTNDMDFYRDTIFNAITPDVPYTFIPAGLQRKLSLKTVDGSEAITSHITAGFQSWAWGNDLVAREVDWDDVDFLSDFLHPSSSIYPGTQFLPPRGLSLTNSDHYKGQDLPAISGPYFLSGHRHALCGAATLSQPLEEEGGPSCSCQFETLGDSQVGDNIELYVGYAEYDQNPSYPDSYSHALVFARWKFYDHPTEDSHWVNEIGVATFSGGTRQDRIFHRTGIPDPGEDWRFDRAHSLGDDFIQHRLSVKAWKDQDDPEDLKVQYSSTYSPFISTITAGASLNPFYSGGSFFTLPDADSGICYPPDSAALDFAFGCSVGNGSTRDFEVRTIDLDLSTAVWATDAEGQQVFPGEVRSGGERRGRVLRPQTGTPV